MWLKGCRISRFSPITKASDLDLPKSEQTQILTFGSTESSRNPSGGIRGAEALWMHWFVVEHHARNLQHMQKWYTKFDLGRNPWLQKFTMYNLLFLLLIGCLPEGWAGSKRSLARSAHEPTSNNNNRNNRNTSYTINITYGIANHVQKLIESTPYVLTY